MFSDVIREAAARYSDTPLYVTPDGGALSYAELDRLSDGVAAACLAARGGAPATVVALSSPRGPPTPWPTPPRPRSAP